MNQINSKGGFVINQFVQHTYLQTWSLVFEKWNFFVIKSVNDYWITLTTYRYILGIYRNCLYE